MWHTAAALHQHVDGGYHAAAAHVSSTVCCCTCFLSCAGDAGDVLMIGISMAVFIWLAMQMYRLYFYVYLQMGVMDMMQ